MHIALSSRYDARSTVRSASSAGSTCQSSARHQPVISQSSASHQPVISQSSASHQPVISQSSASHQPAISQSSASHQSVIGCAQRQLGGQHLGLAEAQHLVII
jgi:hypothetical protein